MVKMKSCQSNEINVSIIIPVYNVAEYLPQCLETVCGQTYKKLEIILVDDGSTDESGKICDEWKQKDERIRVIHKKNGGVSSARNEGLKVAKGEFIGFVDSDDWVEPDMYEKMKKRMGSADVVMSGFFDYPYGMDCQAIPRGIRAVRPCGYEGAVLQIMSRDCYYCTLWNKLYRMKAVKKDGETIKNSGDLTAASKVLPKTGRYKAMAIIGIIALISVILGIRYKSIKLK